MFAIGTLSPLTRKCMELRMEDKESEHTATIQKDALMLLKEVSSIDTEEKDESVNDSCERAVWAFDYKNGVSKYYKTRGTRSMCRWLSRQIKREVKPHMYELVASVIDCGPPIPCRAVLDIELDEKRVYGKDKNVEELGRDIVTWIEREMTIFMRESFEDEEINIEYRWLTSSIPEKLSLHCTLVVNNDAILFRHFYHVGAFVRRFILSRAWPDGYSRTRAMPNRPSNEEVKHLCENTPLESIDVAPYTKHRIMRTIGCIKARASTTRRVFVPLAWSKTIVNTRKSLNVLQNYSTVQVILGFLLYGANPRHVKQLFDIRSLDGGEPMSSGAISRGGLKRSRPDMIKSGGRLVSSTEMKFDFLGEQDSIDTIASKKSFLLHVVSRALGKVFTHAEICNVDWNAGPDGLYHWIQFKSISRYCVYKGEEHKSNTIYFLVMPHRMVYKCYDPDHKDRKDKFVQFNAEQRRLIHSAFVVLNCTRGKEMKFLIYFLRYFLFFLKW